MILRPRAINVALATWLVASVFVFPHAPAQRLISLLAGITALSLALLAQRSLVAHRTVAVVAFGVILSFFFFWPLPATALNNTAVALAMVALAFLNPDRFSTSRRRRL